MPTRMVPAALCIVLTVPAAHPLLAEDVAAGREASIKHCARCHVVGDYNPLGGIDSTPSFQGLTHMSDYVERLQTFYARRPHVAFTRIDGTSSVQTNPAYGPLLEITTPEVENIVAFVKSLGQAQ